MSTQPTRAEPEERQPGQAVRPGQDERAAYLADVCRLLWPEPALVAGFGALRGTRGEPRDLSASAAEPQPAGPGSTSDFIVLPAMRRPRLLVPAGRRAAAAAVRRYGEPGSVQARLATRGLSVILGSGLAAVVLRDRLRVHVPAGALTIETYLSAQLGLDLSVSMHLSAARANRKPVLQLLTPSGETVGFAKVGINPLTKDLIRAEQSALTLLDSARLTSLSVPRVLHAGSWNGLGLIVLSPLPVWRPRAPLPPSQLSRAMKEIAAVAGIRLSPLAASRYWQGLVMRLAGADDTADRSALQRAISSLRQQAGDVVLSFGACHGDWTPWNMASIRGSLQVWDWERFTLGVPVGFDMLHHWLQSQVVSGRSDSRAAAAECVRRSAGLLARLGVGNGEARLTALLYLAELSTRYLIDRQAEMAGRLGAPGRWLIPALTAGIAQL